MAKTNWQHYLTDRGFFSARFFIDFRFHEPPSSISICKCSQITYEMKCLEGWGNNTEKEAWVLTQTHLTLEYDELSY